MKITLHINYQSVFLIVRIIHKNVNIIAIISNNSDFKQLLSLL